MLLICNEIEELKNNNIDIYRRKVTYLQSSDQLTWYFLHLL